MNQEVLKYVKNSGLSNCVSLDEKMTLMSTAEATQKKMTSVRKMAPLNF